jgi:hypothetical protein
MIESKTDSSVQKIALFDDLYDAVYDDSYEFISVWGPPRSSKTTLAMWASYSLYKNWQQVLQSIAFNLPQVMYKLKNGIPARFPTKNGLHMRVPILIWDDYGSFSNKAVTQHELAWDVFKGAFDTLGTQLGVLMATMIDPAEATQQLQNKYTAEIAVFKKGVYKYDRCQWQQDFAGWRTRTKKLYVETNSFDKVPDWVYKEYDKMRQALCDEVMQVIEDTISSTSISTVLKLVKPEDVEILQLIDLKGPLHQHSLDDYGPQAKQAITRLKARGLVVPTMMGKGYYKMDLSPLGQTVLEKLKENKEKPKDSNFSTEY